MRLEQERIGGFAKKLVYTKVAYKFTGKPQKGLLKRISPAKGGHWKVIG